MSGVADSYTASVASGIFRPGSVMPEAEAAARKAVELDDLDGEAHRAMAAIQLFYRWDWQAADKESARAIELKPSLAESHHLRAYVLTTLNRVDEALQEDRKTMELDPFAKPWVLGYAFLHARQFDNALAELRLRSSALPNDALIHSLLADAYLYKGMEREAEEESERALTLFGAKKSVAEEQQAFRAGGYQSVLEWHLARILRRAAKGYVSPLEFAGVYAQLKRKEETLHYLEMSYEERVPFLVFVQCEPKFDFVHSDPRYRAIVTKMRLPPAS